MKAGEAIVLMALCCAAVFVTINVSEQAEEGGKLEAESTPSASVGVVAIEQEVEKKHLIHRIASMVKDPKRRIPPGPFSSELQAHLSARKRKAIRRKERRAREDQRRKRQIFSDSYLHELRSFKDKMADTKRLLADLPTIAEDSPSLAKGKRDDLTEN